MKYCTDDGRHIFNTKQELFDYENKVKAEKEAKTKLAKEKQRRKDIIKKDYDALLDKIAEYNKDYNESVALDRKLLTDKDYDYCRMFLNNLFSVPLWM